MVLIKGLQICRQEKACKFSGIIPKILEEMYECTFYMLREFFYACVLVGKCTLIRRLAERHTRHQSQFMHTFLAVCASGRTLLYYY